MNAGIWVAAIAGIVLGYLAGRLRPGRRLFERAYDVATGDGRRGPRWAASVLLALLGLAVHPCRSIRNIRSWRQAEKREPAPQIKPHWGQR